MGNTLLTPTIIAKECLKQLKNNCVMAELVYRGYESEWEKTYNSWKPGQTITVKAPVYFRVQDGATMNAVDLFEQSTTFTLSYRKHVAWPVTAEEMTYSIDKYSERFIQPAMQALANYIDTVLLGLYKYIPNQVGTPGQTPSNYLTFALANAKMSEHACPQENRRCVVDPQAQAYLSDHLKGLFAPAIVGKAVEQSKFGMIAGLDTYMSQNVATHTPGTAAGLATILMNATSAEGDVSVNIDTNGSWVLTLADGDIFTIAAVNGVNPISGNSTGSLRQFVSLAHTDNGNDATISCTPGAAPYKIYSSAATKTYLPYQTVDTLPQNNAAVTVAGTASTAHKVNLAFHKDCLGLAMVPLEVPTSVVWKARETYDGYSIRIVRDYDITNDKEYIRADVLFGVKALNPFLGCRIAG